MRVERRSQDTLTAVELDVGDELSFALMDGVVRSIKVCSASAKVERRGPGWSGQENGVITYRIACELSIDGILVQLVRTIPSRQNFAPPHQLFGMRVWLDAAGDMASVLSDDHGAGSCFPERQVRLAVWDERRRICPVLLHPWCPLPPGGLRLEDCYRGEDTWMGPYCGLEAHNGLDINHPAGTTLWAPLSIDEHEMFDEVAKGANNNRWQGLHRWANGTTWALQSMHLIRLLVPEDQPIAAGTAYAISGGQQVGAVEHSHFVFHVREDGDDIALDPWLLFWQMYEDRALTTGTG
jgi:hypothetical protein